MLICRSRGGTGILQAAIFLLVVFFSPAAPRATSGVQRQRKSPSKFASELTNDTLTKTSIIQAVGDFEANYVQSDTSRAGLACSISKILFSKANNTTEGYLDALDDTEYTNRTNAYWSVVLARSARVLHWHTYLHFGQVRSLLASISVHSSAKVNKRGGAVSETDRFHTHQVRGPQWRA